MRRLSVMSDHVGLPEEVVAPQGEAHAMCLKIISLVIL